VTCETAVQASNGQIKINSAKKRSYSTTHNIELANLPGTTNVDVPAITLDKALQDGGLERVSLLKIDCERSEYGIFSTTTDEIASKIDKIAMEVHIVPNHSVKSLHQRLDQSMLSATGHYLSSRLIDVMKAQDGQYRIIARPSCRRSGNGAGV
jgi:Methyltransferase FkbM domain